VIVSGVVDTSLICSNAIAYMFHNQCFTMAMTGEFIQMLFSIKVLPCVVQNDACGQETGAEVHSSADRYHCQARLARQPLAWTVSFPGAVYSQ